MTIGYVATVYKLISYLKSKTLAFDFFYCYIGIVDVKFNELRNKMLKMKINGALVKIRPEDVAIKAEVDFMIELQETELSSYLFNLIERVAQPESKTHISKYIETLNTDDIIEAYYRKFGKARRAPYDVSKNIVSLYPVLQSASDNLEWYASNIRYFKCYFDRMVPEKNAIYDEQIQTLAKMSNLKYDPVSTNTKTREAIETYISKICLILDMFTRKRAMIQRHKTIEKAITTIMHNANKVDHRLSIVEKAELKANNVRLSVSKLLNRLNRGAVLPMFEDMLKLKILKRYIDHRFEAHNKLSNTKAGHRCMLTAMEELGFSTENVKPFEEPILVRGVPMARENVMKMFEIAGYKADGYRF